MPLKRVYWLLPQKSAILALLTSLILSMIPISIFSGNIQGGTTKNRLEYGILQSINNIESSGNNLPDVILCQETWQKESFKVTENQNYSYHSNTKFNQNKKSHIGSGQQAVIKQKFKHKVLNYSERILITLINIIHIINIYAPQTNHSDYKKYNFKTDLIKVINEQITDDIPILILGDYNIPKTSLGNSYLSSLTNHGQLLLCNQPTQKYGNELDYGILFNKNLSLKTKETKLVDIATSDHDGILINLEKEDYVLEEELKEKSIPRLKIELPKNFFEIQRYQHLVKKSWNKFMNDNPDLKSFFNTPLKLVCPFRHTDHRSKLNRIYEGLREIIINSATSVTKKRKKTNKRNQNHSQSAKKIYQSYKSGKITKCKFKRKLKRLQIAENIKMSNKLVANIKNSKKFYQLCKKITSNSDPLVNNKSIPFKKFSETYSKIYEPENFTKCDLMKLKKKYQLTVTKEMIYRPYELAEIKTAFSQINKKKASRGPVIELWELANIYEVITQMLNKFNQHGYFPEEFLKCEIVLLKKCNTKQDSDHTNYRPISLIESLSKVSEILIRNRIPWSISKAQYAYQKKVGTLTCLKDYTSMNSHYVSKYGISVSVFLDMSKAFDKLSLKSLLLKLEVLLKDDPVTLRLVSAMLTTTTSVINDTYTIKPRSGIRQGSLLSPLLFIQSCDQWINQVNNSKHGKIFVYADDITLLSNSFSWVQQQLNTFSIFCERNSLLANPTKCCVMVSLNSKNFNYYNGTIKRKLPNLVLNNVTLQYVNNFKYLGYTLNNSRTDLDHLAIIFSKFRCKALTIRRFFRNTNDKTLTLLIKSYLISTLYGLELSKNFTKQYRSRYNYILSIAFGVKTSNIDQKLRKYPELQLQNVHKKASCRYAVLEHRNFNPY